MHKTKPVSSTETDYERIFEQRGVAYDRAMKAFPRARAQEFEALLRLAALKDGEAVCDFPAGGGYSRGFIDKRVELTLVETSPVFFDLCPEDARCRKFLTKNNVIPCAERSFDKILSLAGLHHNDGQADFFVNARVC